MAFDPSQLTKSERERCLQVLGRVRGRLDVLPLGELGEGPQQLACEFMRRRAGEVVDAEISAVIASIPR